MTTLIYAGIVAAFLLLGYFYVTAGLRTKYPIPFLIVVWPLVFVANTLRRISG